MSDQTLSRMYIEFAEKGFSEAAATTEKFKEKLEQAHNSAELLKKALESGHYQKTADQFARVNSQMDRLKAQAKQLDLQAQFGKIGAAVVGVNEQFGQLNQMVRHSAAAIAGPAAAAFGILSASVMGFVRAGLQGTIEGYRLQHAFGLISKEVAAIFLPIINKVTDFAQRLAGWLRRLSGDGQDLAMKITVVGGAMLFAAATFPVIIAGITGVIAAVLALAAALATADTFAAGIPAAIGLIVTVLTALLTAIGVVGTGGATLFALSDMGGRVMRRLGDALERVGRFLAPLGDALGSVGRILGRMLDQSMRLADALVSPFVKLFDRLSGGQNPLEVFADVLDRIANYVDDHIYPAFVRVADMIEGVLTGALNKVENVINRLTSGVGRFVTEWKRFIPIIGLVERFYANTRASDPSKKPHRSTSPMQTEFGDALSYFHKVSEAGMKTAAGYQEKRPEEETAKNTEDIAKWTQTFDVKMQQLTDTIRDLVNTLTNPKALAREGVANAKEVVHERAERAWEEVRKRLPKLGW